MKRVLLDSLWYDPPLYQGVADYATEAEWHLEFGQSKIRDFPTDTWRGDGIIARLSSYSDEHLNMLRESGIPVVDIQSRPDAPVYPLVGTDISQTVRLAFDFFRYQKGHHHFGFCGNSNSLRGKAFIKLVAGEGFDCSAFYMYFKQTGERDEILEWIARSPKPLAVYCDNDWTASFLISVLLEHGISVPETVAVLGTDNDEMICKASHVPISSVDTNLTQVGFNAAKLLDHAMSGERVENRQHLVQPKEVVERASTDMLAVKSPKVRAAIGIMRRDFKNQLTIGDIVLDLCMSQAGLERAFKRELGITPAVCLRDIRMREAAKLLRQTKEKIARVAHLVGYPNSKHFATTFRKAYGIPPLSYRKENSE